MRLLPTGFDLAQASGAQCKVMLYLLSQDAWGEGILIVQASDLHRSLGLSRQVAINALRSIAGIRSTYMPEYLAWRIEADTAAAALPDDLKAYSDAHHCAPEVTRAMRRIGIDEVRLRLSYFQWIVEQGKRKIANPIAYLTSLLQKTKINYHQDFVSPSTVKQSLRTWIEAIEMCDYADIAVVYRRASAWASQPGLPPVYSASIEKAFHRRTTSKVPTY